MLSVTYKVIYISQMVNPASIVLKGMKKVGLLNQPGYVWLEFQSISLLVFLQKARDNRKSGHYWVRRKCEEQEKVTLHCECRLYLSVEAERSFWLQLFC